jgi:hypothetical protein
MIEWKDCKYREDLQTIVDMATGADTSYLTLRWFLCDCDEKGMDVEVVRQFAKLIRVLNKEDNK